VIVIFVKMGALATCTFILFSDLGKILQSAVAYNVVSFGEFREKLCEENCTFFMGGNGITLWLISCNRGLI